MCAHVTHQHANSEPSFESLATCHGRGAGVADGARKTATPCTRAVACACLATGTGQHKDARITAAPGLPAEQGQGGDGDSRLSFAARGGCGAREALREPWAGGCLHLRGCLLGAAWLIRRRKGNSSQSRKNPDQKGYLHHVWFLIPTKSGAGQETSARSRARRSAALLINYRGR